MTNNVYHLRLINGDEIIGELTGATEESLLIQKPMLVSEITDDKTRMSTIVLSKYVLFDDNQEIPFKKIHVVTQTHILEEIKNYYYNSIKYNARFVEPVIKRELIKVNGNMQDMLENSGMGEDELIASNSAIVEELRFYHPGSNTYN